MVRRTKADALATRNSLLDAAEHLFQARGVSRTSLNDIAIAAGTTRGAIYWHFKDKADLFNAMMERVTLPLEGTLACTARTAETTANPLLSLRDSMMSALTQTATDEQTRRVFEVATHKVEYVTEMQEVRDRHLQVRNECMAMTEEILQQAVQREGIQLTMPVATAALGLHVIMDGLIQNWLLDSEAFDLVKSGRHTMDAFLMGLGFTLPAARAPHRATKKRVSPTRAAIA
jgi:TetR/AcrR family acrAB operon transcriptional repressor